MELKNVEKMKILFVAPFAHCDGHHCYVAGTESEALSKAGFEVLLLTFTGLIDDSVCLSVKTRSLLSPRRRDMINRIISHEITKWPFMLVTVLATLIKAVQIYNREQFNIIHLRDADPFPFLPRLVGMFASNTRWVVSLLATLKRVHFIGPLSRFPLWSVVYRISLNNRNQYLYVCQNDQIKSYYSKEFLGGILNGNVFELTPMISTSNSYNRKISETEAKAFLRLPSEKRIFLSFGSVHNGKDPETIFSALESFPNLLCLHAGKTTSNMITKFDRLKNHYNGSVKFIDRYIPEVEKPYYFAASSVIILAYTKDFRATSSMLWEACRFRTPIIASDSAQLGELVHSFGLGLTFESQNPTSLREAISKFVSFGDDRISVMKANCDKFCSYFSSEDWTIKCSDLYQRLEQTKPMLKGHKLSGHVYITNEELAPHELV